MLPLELPTLLRPRRVATAQMWLDQELPWQLGFAAIAQPSASCGIYADDNRCAPWQR